ncbi:hypothetical protein KAZ01_01350 [Candidatus Gracilibacteria bacterium]|nr:hypothetical protein [Candidatus Gracilibacteria bacterium]
MTFNFGNYIVFGNTGDIKVKDPISGNSNRNDYLEPFYDNSFFTGDKTGEKGAKYLLLNIAKDVKNAAIAVAIIFLIVLVLRLIFSSAADDDVKKWKIGIMWTTIGIVVMQSAYVIFYVLFDENIGAPLASNFLDAVIRPVIRLLEMAASFAFIAMAIFAFYKLVTSGGKEDATKTAIQTILSAIMGFILIKISGVLVNSIYGEVKCTEYIGTNICTGANLGNPNLSETVKLIAKMIQYVNGFVGIITVVLIIFAGYMIVTSNGNEEKLKKGKQTIIYIFIGIIIIVTSVILFQLIGGAEYDGGYGTFKTQEMPK